MVAAEAGAGAEGRAAVTPDAQDVAAVEHEGHCRLLARLGHVPGRAVPRAAGVGGLVLNDVVAFGAENGTGPILTERTGVVRVLGCHVSPDRCRAGTSIT